MWNEAWVVLVEAGQFIRRHWVALTPWVLAIVAANWVGDVARTAMSAGSGARTLQPEPLTILGVGRAFGWAAGSAVQPGQGINPPWELVPEMTNPFLLLGLANALEVFIAVGSALLINRYLLRAARPLKSRKWLAAAPGAVLVLVGMLLWFRLYGPISDLVAITFRVMLPEYTVIVWQILAWVLFVPFMFTAYLMMLERLEAPQAARASSRLLRRNWRSAAPLFVIGFVFFSGQTLLIKAAPVAGPTLAMGFALTGTAVRVGLGFLLATAWLLWADARYTPDMKRT